MLVRSQYRCMVTEYVLSKVESVIQILHQIVTYSCLPSLLWSKKSVFVGLNRYWRFVVCAHLQIISFRLLTFLSLLSVIKSLAVLVYIVLFKRISRKRETLVSPAIFESYYNGPHTFSGPSFSFKPKGT